jgi:3-oxoacyl-[acyl-carrier-protein] synthase-1
MSRSNDICVLSAGVVCAVGGTAASSCAAIRACLDNFCQTHLVDEVGQPLLGAPVPDVLLGLDDEADGHRQGGVSRLARMFVRAATECVRGTGGVDARHTALLLLGPEASRPGVTPPLLNDCFAACQQAVKAEFHAASRITQIGSPGLAAALDYAQTLLADTAASGVHSVLVAGVDSLLNTPDIHALLAQGRLLTSANSDGFIPGEAAACVLVTRLDAVVPCARDPHGGQEPRAPVLRVAGVGRAREPDCWASGRPNHGKGLAKTILAALKQAGLPADAMHHRLSGASGESFFMDEGTSAWARVLRAPSPPGYTAELVASSCGELGAAIGPLLVALALDMARKDWAAGPHTLLHLSSESPPRAALVLQAV